jgi:hypothetical protein
VVETHPIAEGEPFPTLFWLVCRRLIGAVGGLESTGRMQELNDRLLTDEHFRGAFDAANFDYIVRRDAHHVLPGTGGVGGGPLDRIKCLHAHLAHHLVCGCNPVGAWVMENIEDPCG